MARVVADWLLMRHASVSQTIVRAEIEVTDQTILLSHSNNNDNNDVISIALFHVKHAQLR